MGSNEPIEAELEEFRDLTVEGLAAIVRNVSWGNVWLFVIMLIELVRLFGGVR